MPTELKLIIGLNVVATVVLAFFTLGGGGFVAGVLPPDQDFEIKMVMIAPPREERVVAAAPVARLDIPAEYRTPDLSPSPWKILPDGSVRFDDADR
jgi:hypothetical protein